MKQEGALNPVYHTSKDEDLRFSCTTSCLICGETVEIGLDPLFANPRICERCKKAVMKMRKKMEEGEE